MQIDLQILIPIVAAITGSFLAFILTFYKEQKRSTNHLKVNCRILFEELRKHAYWLFTQKDTDIILMIRKESFNEWNIIKYDIPDLPFDEFEILLKHFQKMISIQTAYDILDSENHCKIPDELKSEAKKRCRKAYWLLYLHCYADDPPKMQDYHPDQNPYT